MVINAEFIRKEDKYCSRYDVSMVMCVFLLVYLLCVLFFFVNSAVRQELYSSYPNKARMQVKEG